MSTGTVRSVFAVAERRERAAKSGNSDLKRQHETINGFAIPAPPNADGIQMAQLVPQLGMCSHLPPPSPNQLLRMRLPESALVVHLYEQIQVTGELQIEQSSETVFPVDGMQRTEATWLLKAVSSKCLALSKSVSHQERRSGLIRKSGSASDKFH
ncbi:DUF3299 domain-containing protein [Ruegeria arenilitoris]|uniref:DUF3299 domain-containing protein n=1 Tax=Ruegeria arenilitoris TaxID=1173585 RepID=UPI00147D1078